MRSILELHRFGPDGKPHKPDAYVFGNAIGSRIDSRKRSFASAVLRAHGYEPSYDKGRRHLDAEFRTRLRSIDLHFHDLRREAGSRWLDGGVPLHAIREWLGHTSISQTSVYLATTIAGQHAAMAAYEARMVRRSQEHAPSPLQQFAVDPGTSRSDRHQTASTAVN